MCPMFWGSWQEPEELPHQCWGRGRASLRDETHRAEGRALLWGQRKSWGGILRGPWAVVERGAQQGWV